VIDTVEPYHGPVRLKGDITFENVIFGYTKERPVLKGIDLHIPAGRKVALVGYSGSGKTTLVKLIPRFYELELGTYSFGVNTHTIAVNEQTQEIYLPLVKEGNRPVLRILRYNANVVG